MNVHWKSWMKIWAVLLVVFALGCVTGASLDGIYRLRAKSDQPTLAPPMRDTDAYFETLKRELTLTEEQSSAMRAILDRTREDYKAVCADVRPRYDSLRERTRSQMRALLTADQQPRFDSIITQEDCRCPEQKK
jgi:Spy/CpxP family protein refolding chaperone